MAALLSSNSTYLLAGSSHSLAAPGILLNARSLSAPLHPRLHQPASSFASSSSSTSGSPSDTLPEPPSRKIRFAPLPDPRRDDFPSVFYDSDSDRPPVVRNQSPAVDPCSPPSPHSVPGSDLAPDSSPIKSKSRTWGRKLLRPLLNPLLPSAPSCPNGAHSGLCRVSSRDSVRGGTDTEDACKAGVPLSRRMSTSGVAFSKEAERSQTYRDGAPLTSVVSEGFSSKGRKDGLRMLNGRVYGRRPSSADPTQKQDNHEPEFVEWGYGGMGSVTSNPAPRSSPTAGPNWAKLQSNGKILGDNADDGDDGSGMGWVKRRREQREREKKEREEREKTQQDAPVPEIAVHPPESKDKSRESAGAEADRDPKHSDVAEHHVLRAVSIPAHHHHPRHHFHHKPGESSGTVTPTSALSLSRTNSASSVPLFRTASYGSQGETLSPMPEKKEETEMSSGSSVTSSASATSASSVDGDGEEDDEDDEDNTERESDDDSSDDAEGRLTSRGAGVEKISRHKE
ncbi:hypothetical protein K439DRAFT_93121 [Ramaria rubella]|nr:hypothetical protein K439DRAFT_93121 [Ramaria rubella]